MSWLVWSGLRYERLGGEGVEGWVGDGVGMAVCGRRGGGGVSCWRWRGWVGALLKKLPRLKVTGRWLNGLPGY